MNYKDYKYEIEAFGFHEYLRGRDVKLYSIRLNYAAMEPVGQIFFRSHSEAKKWAEKIIDCYLEK